MVFAPVVISNPPRAAYYDRNPSTQNIAFFVAAVAPHGSTVRATYTTPAARKAFVTAIALQTRRVSVASPVGRVDVFVQVNGTKNIGNVTTTSNTADKDYLSSSSGGHTLNAGDALTILDADASTGGTCDFGQTCGLVEFDA